jgi:ankyrin repeat protein
MKFTASFIFLWGILLLCVLTLTHGGLDYLWDATFEADDLRVEHLLDIQEDGLLKAGSFQVDATRVEATDRRTALMMCGYADRVDIDRQKVDRKCKAIGKMLVAAGADPSHIDSHGWDALSMASVKGFTVYSQFLLQQKGVDIDRLDNEGRSAIMKAAGHGHIDTVELLWRRGAEARRLDPDGSTLLQLVVKLAMADEMLFPLLNEMLTKVITADVGADAAGDDDVSSLRRPQVLSIDQRDRNGRTALHYCIFGHHVEALHVLIEHGADLSLPDNFGVTPVDMARGLGGLTGEQVVEVLLLATADQAVKRHDAWVQQQDADHGFL